MNLFETLIHPEREEDLNRTEIARAANELQVGEFQLLQLAYYHWHGHDMTEEQSRGLFGAYMLEHKVPSWARHYARQVLLAAQRNEIDSTNPVYHRYDDDYVTQLPDGLRRFLTASFFVVLIIGGGIGFSVFIGATSQQLLPPYFEEEELRRTPAEPEPKKTPLNGS